MKVAGRSDGDLMGGRGERKTRLSEVKTGERERGG